MLIFLKCHPLNVAVSDVGMDGLLILHAAQGSQDSTDSGSLPPTYSRLPPDGHEFPEDYVDPGHTGHADPQTEFLSRKSSASSTSSLDRNQLRANTSTRNKKVQSCACDYPEKSPFPVF